MLYTKGWCMKKLTIKQQKFIDEYIISGEYYGVVYKIKNLKNGKHYIGITTRTIEERFEEHCKANSGIGNAIRKYGRNLFFVKILDVAFTQEELYELEVKYIEEYNSYKNGYNQTIGGDGVVTTPRLKIELTEQQKQFIKYVERENKKEIDVMDSLSMVKMLLQNSVLIYLTTDRYSDKKKIARMILRLKPQLIKSILKTNLLDYGEIKEYAYKKMLKPQEV